jgi:hypothetical protein
MPSFACHNPCPISPYSKFIIRCSGANINRNHGTPPGSPRAFVPARGLMPRARRESGAHRPTGPQQLVAPVMSVLLLEMSVWNAAIVPGMTIPPVTPPAGVYMTVETRYTALIVTPPPIIMPRPVPMTFPGAPPPAAPEKEVYPDFRSNVHTGGTGQHYHIRRLGNDRRRQGNTKAYIDPCHRGNRGQHHSDSCQQHYQNPGLINCYRPVFWKHDPHLLSPPKDTSLYGAFICSQRHAFRGPLPQPFFLITRYKELHT